MTFPTSSADTVYAQPQQVIADFSFDEKVASVFSDMIQRSIPGYRTILKQLGLFTTLFCQENSNYYDLGCSLGAATLAMRQNINAPGGKIIAVDNSAAMIQRCQNHVLSFNFITPVEFHCCDLQDITIEQAAIVTLNFTLQFIKPEERQTIINRIYQGLKPGGLLFMSEKLTLEDKHINALLINAHHQFKRNNGYSDLEISQKRTALENVMIPDTPSCHVNRMQQAGFAHISQWYQNLNFASFIAVK
jgi:tRNA (cmo5U34)-methyltransferase